MFETLQPSRSRLRPPAVGAYIGGLEERLRHFKTRGYALKKAPNPNFDVYHAGMMSIYTPPPVPRGAVTGYRGGGRDMLSYGGNTWKGGPTIDLTQGRNGVYAMQRMKPPKLGGLPGALAGAAADWLLGQLLENLPFPENPGVNYNRNFSMYPLNCAVCGSVERPCPTSSTGCMSCGEGSGMAFYSPCTRSGTLPNSPVSAGRTKLWKQMPLVAGGYRWYNWGEYGPGIPFTVPGGWKTRTSGELLDTRAAPEPAIKPMAYGGANPIGSALTNPQSVSTRQNWKKPRQLHELPMGDGAGNGPPTDTPVITPEPPLPPHVRVPPGRGVREVKSSTKRALAVAMKAALFMTEVRDALVVIAKGLGWNGKEPLVPFLWREFPNMTTKQLIMIMIGLGVMHYTDKAWGRAFALRRKAGADLLAQIFGPGHKWYYYQGRLDI